MKTIMLVVALVVAAGLGAFSVHQQNRLKSLESQAAALQAEVDELHAALAEKEAAQQEMASAALKAKVLQETLSQASAISVEQSNQVARLEESLASAQTNAPGFGQIFDDPDIREMVKTQQQAALGPIIERNYGQLLKDLGLTPEQANRVKELLMRKMSVGTELGMSLLGGNVDASKQKEIRDKIRSETSAVDQALKEFLGEENFNRVQAHERELPTRMAMSQFKDEVASSGVGLSGQQEQQLLEVMNQTRQNFKWSTDYESQNGATELSMAEMFNEDRMNKHFEERRLYNEEMVGRARTFLNENQLNAFEDHLERQRKLQESAMKMAARMLAPQSAQPRR